MVQIDDGSEPEAATNEGGAAANSIFVSVDRCIELLQQAELEPTKWRSCIRKSCNRVTAGELRRAWAASPLRPRGEEAALRGGQVARAIFPGAGTRAVLRGRDSCTGKDFATLTGLREGSVRSDGHEVSHRTLGSRPAESWTGRPAPSAAQRKSGLV